MRLTRASSYALHALVFMAAQKHNRPIPSHIVAQARSIPERFLLKVLKPLVSARVLASVNGRASHRPAFAPPVFAARRTRAAKARRQRADRPGRWQTRCE